MAIKLISLCPACGKMKFFIAIISKGYREALVCEDCGLVRLVSLGTSKDKCLPERSPELVK